jgi:hypothetical protein
MEIEAAELTPLVEPYQERPIEQIRPVYGDSFNIFPSFCPAFRPLTQ